MSIIHGWQNTRYVLVFVLVVAISRVCFGRCSLTGRQVDAGCALLYIKTWRDVININNRV